MTEQMPGDEVYSDDLADEQILRRWRKLAALAEQEYADEDVLERASRRCRSWRSSVARTWASRRS